MRGWLLFLLKLPFLCVAFVLYAAYFLLWHLLRTLGHNVSLGLGLLAAVILGLQQNEPNGAEMVGVAVGWVAINRVCYFLTRLLPRPGARPSIRMPKAPRRAVMAAPSPVRIAVPRCPGSASPGELTMRSRLDPALQAIMQG